MLNKFIESLENHRMTVVDWLIGFSGIVLVRLILESFSSPTPGGVLHTDSFAVIHLVLFFFTAILGLICITGYFTKKYLHAAKFILFVLPVIWLAPIIDIILSLGKGSSMSYVYDTKVGLLADYFKFLTLQKVAGVTFGMHFTYLLLFFIIGYYVWTKIKKVSVVFYVLIFSYTLLFIIGTLPSLIYLLTHFENGFS
jgi:hypothetical protein